MFFLSHVHFGICNLVLYAEDFVKIQILRLEGPHVPCVSVQDNPLLHDVIGLFDAFFFLPTFMKEISPTFESELRYLTV